VVGTLASKLERKDRDEDGNGCRKTGQIAADSGSDNDLYIFVVV
jgi:hypothetical protein